MEAYYQYDIENKTLTLPEQYVLVKDGIDIKLKPIKVAVKFNTQEELDTHITFCKDENREFKGKYGYTGFDIVAKYKPNTARWYITVTALISTGASPKPWEFSVFDFDLDYIFTHILGSEAKGIWKHYPFNIAVRRSGRFFPKSEGYNKDRFEDIEKDLENLRKGKAHRLEIQLP